MEKKKKTGGEGKGGFWVDIILNRMKIYFLHIIIINLLPLVIINFFSFSILYVYVYVKKIKIKNLKNLNLITFFFIPQDFLFILFFF